MIKKEYRLITICTKPEIGKTCELIAIRDGLERKIRTSPVEDFYLSQYKNVVSTKHSVYIGYENIYTDPFFSNELID